MYYSVLELPKIMAKPCDSLWMSIIFPHRVQPTVHGLLNVLTLPSFGSLLYNPQSVNQPNKGNDGYNITFTDLHFANNMTANWSEAYNIRHGCLDENNTTQVHVVVYMMFKNTTYEPRKLRVLSQK